MAEAREPGPTPSGGPIVASHHNMRLLEIFNWIGLGLIGRSIGPGRADLPQRTPPCLGLALNE